MLKSRKIVISDSLQDYLNINENDINIKIKDFASRINKLNDEELIDNKIAKNYIDFFTKEELVVILIYTTSIAGFLEYKIIDLMEKANIPLPLFQKIMDLDFSDEDFMMKNKDKDNQDEDFI